MIYTIRYRSDAQKLLPQLQPGDLIRAEDFNRIGKNTQEVRKMTSLICDKGAAIQIGARFYNLNNSDAEAQLARDLEAWIKPHIVGKPPKLSEAEKAEIRSRFEAGTSKTRLAQAFNTSWTTIDIAIKQGV